jgi:hypothetical protein
MRVRPPLLAVGALLLALDIASCAKAARPDDAVRAWIAAVTRDDPQAAYDLLSAETRREVTREQFLARWRENREVARAEAQAMQTALGERGASSSARVHYGEGLAVPVVLDRSPAPEGWHLSDVPTPRNPHASTPEEALAQFLRAVEARDWDAISRAVSAPTREAVDRELRERMAALHESHRTEVAGDHARVRLGRYELLLERSSAGDWRVIGIR